MQDSPGPGFAASRAAPVPFREAPKVPSFKLVLWVAAISAVTTLGIQHYQKMKGA
jgi:hypothetical protein